MRDWRLAMFGVSVRDGVVVMQEPAWIFLPVRALVFIAAVAVTVACIYEGVWFLAVPIALFSCLPLISTRTHLDVVQGIVERQLLLAGYTIRSTRLYFPRDARVMIRRVGFTNHPSSADLRHFVLLVWSASEIEVYCATYACSAVRFMRLLRRIGGFKVQPRVRS